MIADRIRQLDENIWIVHGPDVVFAGAAMHTRMTVVRLSRGGLWMHSPIELDATVTSFIEELGEPVSALVAPNKFHHLFVQAWRQAFPDAAVFAEAGLMKKIPELADAQVLTDTPALMYRDDIDQVLFSGNRMFEEAVFFHQPSRTLIFTDLMINLPTDHIRGLAKLFLRFEGVVYPNGGVPRLYRWFTTNKAAARQAAEAVLAWSPSRIVLSHGEIFEQDVAQVLRREFAYLIGSA